jgi:hypothetical protein
MKVTASAFVAPAGLAVAGAVWVALGYRLAFHGVPPETGFFKRPQGPNLERWLFDAPMLFVLVGLACLALIVCSAWFRQRRSLLALVFLFECFAFAFAFAMPVIWYIGVKGSGGVFI